MGVCVDAWAACLRNRQVGSAGNGYNNRFPLAQKLNEIASCEHTKNAVGDWLLSAMVMLSGLLDLPNPRPSENSRIGGNVSGCCRSCL